jgi:hypothetical protein
MVFPALLLSGILVAANEMATQPNACSIADAMKSKTLPANATDPKAQVEHAALLYYGDAFAGILYGTRGNTIWYQGSGLPGQSISAPSRARALAMLGIATAGAAPVAAPNPSLTAILAPDVKIRGCF